jgi:hypothetical protein
VSGKPDLTRAGDFLERHARLLDRHRFSLLFDHGPAEPVIAAIRAYRNDDGGFGHALEPDLRTPFSQPIAAVHGLEGLADAGAFGDPMVDQLCDWLTTVSTPEGGVPFVLRSAEGHARAPWWAIPDGDLPVSLTVTGLLAATLHEHGSTHSWLDRADACCWSLIDKLNFTSAYDVRSALAFLDQVPDRERAERVLAQVGEGLLASDLVAWEPDAAGEVHSPLDFAGWPDRPSRTLFTSQQIEPHLDALAAGQADDGGWTFNWMQWSPAATLDWRGFVSVRALQILRAHARL